MAGTHRRPPTSPASLWDAVRRLLGQIDPRPEGPPRRFSLGRRPASGSHPSQGESAKLPDLSPDLDRTLQLVRAELDAEHNSDVVIRPFLVGTAAPRRAFVVYIDGLVDRTTVSEYILQPLMLLAALNPRAGRDNPLAAVEEQLAPGAAVTCVKNLANALEKMLTGMTALFLDGCREALLIESKGWEKRGIERPQEEPGVRGPQDSFTETLRVNTALIRRRLRTPKLTIENLQVGQLSRTDVALVYLRELADPKLVEEIRRRIRNVSVDLVESSGTLEQLIEDRPSSLFTQVLSTERPDRVVGSLAEGFVGVLVDNSSFALVVPTTFATFFHASDDYYVRWPFGTFMRLVRLGALFLSLFLPAFYVASIAYHQSMIPTALLLAITAARENVPFPTPFEVLFMEFSFELVREAGLRIPNVIGPTIGIVGALILGQAAVAANLISPMLVVVVALTAVGSFAIPNYSASFTVRIIRFAMILLAAMMGFFGMAVGVFLLLLHVASLQTFGVPYLSPVGPYRPGAPDLILRGPLYRMQKRPAFVHPQNPERQPDQARQWDKEEKNR
jgi:spore germination protein KA